MLEVKGGPVTRRTRFGALSLMTVTIILVGAWFWGDLAAVNRESAATEVECSPTDLRLVTAEPRSDLERNRPFPTQIHCLTRDGRLVERWESPRKYTQFVRVYESSGVVLIGLGDGQTDELRVVRLPDLDGERRIVLDGPTTVLEVHLVTSAGAPVALQLKRFDAEQGRFEMQYLDWPNGEATAAPPGLANGEAAIALTGVGPSPEVVWTRIDGDGRLDTTVGGVRLPSEAISIPLRSAEAGKGWNIVASTDDYLAMQQIPFAKSQTSIATLIYRRVAKEWKQFTLPGAETWLRPIDRWLVGQVAEAHPDTDPQQSVSFAPLRRSSHVILDPRSGSLTTLDLGVGAEVLALGKDWIVFRRGEELIRASLSGNEISGAQVLVTAPLVKHAHWAWLAGGRVAD